MIFWSFGTPNPGNMGFWALTLLLYVYLCLVGIVSENVIVATLRMSWWSSKHQQSAVDQLVRCWWDLRSLLRSWLLNSSHDCACALTLSAASHLSRVWTKWRNELFTTKDFPQMIKLGFSEYNFLKWIFSQKIIGYNLTSKITGGENVVGKIAFGKM